MSPLNETTSANLGASSVGSATDALDSASAIRWGEIYWITGLPGSGKTTIARALQTALNQPSALLDGDELRAALGVTGQFDPSSRHALAFTYARLAQLLSRQSLPVIVATVSMFDEIRAWNRTHLPRYFEVFVDAPAEQRHLRRKLYAHALTDARIEGNDAYQLPKHAHLTLVNAGNEHPDQLAARIKRSADNHFAEAQ